MDDVDWESEKEFEFDHMHSGARLRAATTSVSLPPGNGSDFRLAWLWAEGWRAAQLRKSGEIVEQTRWEWRLDRTMRPNKIAKIVARSPRALVRSDGRVRGCGGEGEVGSLDLD